MKISETIHIQAPIEQVFDAFTDLQQAQNNLSGIKDLEVLEGSAQMEVGTKWKETRSMMGKDSTEVMWVSALEKHESYVVDAYSHGTKYRSVFTFASVSDGTLVEWEFEGLPQTIGAKIMSLSAWVFKGSLRKMLFKDLEDLKAAIEG